MQSRLNELGQRYETDYETHFEGDTGTGFDSTSCTDPAAWTWENPLPSGNHLYGIWGRLTCWLHPDRPSTNLG